MNITIRIGGVPLDLFADEEVVITRTLRSVQDLNLLFSDFTQQFSIPATDNNNQILGHWYDISILNSINATQAIFGTFEIGGQSNEEGCSIELTGAAYEMGEPTQYSIVVYGISRRIKDELGKRDLQTLDLSAFNHQYNYTALRQSWQGNLLGGSILYPLFDLTTGYVYQPTNNNFPSQNIANITGSIPLVNQRPAILMRDLLVQCFAAVNLEVVGLWLTDTRLNNLYVMGMEKAGNYVDEVLTGLASAKNSQPIFVTNLNISFQKITGFDIEFDPTGRINLATQEYTANVAGVYGFAFNGTIQSIYDSTKPLLLDLIVNGVLEGDPQLVTSIVGGNASASWTVTLNAGDKVWVAAIGSLLQRSVTFHPFAVFQCNVTPVGGSVLNVAMSGTMPQIEISAFIQSCVNAFNLVFRARSRTQIEVTFLDEWYAAGQRVDITPYVDHTSYTADRMNVPRSLLFSHDQKDDIQNEVYRLANGQDFGQTLFTNPADFADGELQIETVFQIPVPTAIALLNNAGVETGLTNLETLKAYDLDLNAVQLPLVLFYYAGEQVVTERPYIDTNFDGTARVQLTTWPMSRPYAERPSDTDTLSVAFGVEGVLNPNFETAPAQTLTQQYWAKYIQNAFDPFGRIFTIQANLPFGLLSTDGLNSQVFYNGQTYVFTELVYSTMADQWQLTLQSYRFDVQPFAFATFGNQIQAVGQEFTPEQLTQFVSYPENGGRILPAIISKSARLPLLPEPVRGVYLAANNTAATIVITTAQNILGVLTTLLTSGGVASFNGTNVLIEADGIYRISFIMTGKLTSAGKTANVQLLRNGLPVGMVVNVAGNDQKQIVIEYAESLLQGNIFNVRAVKFSGGGPLSIDIIQRQIMVHRL